MEAERLRALFGTDEPVAPTLALRAGPLALRVRGTRLLSVCCEGHEVWHGAAFLYRDPDWGTPEPVVEGFEVEERADGFRVQVRARVPVVPAIDLRITIVGDAGGRIRYEGTAVPRGDVATHRTGLCLLHPQALAGQRVVVLHEDGRRSESSFPRLIAPWPPFLGVRGIGHAFGDGGWAEARFEGDVFEFEDQRNNADASFKTYNRSNLMPRPYRLRAGEPVHQAVELWLARAPDRAAPPSAGPVAPWAPAAAAAPTRIGIGITPADAQAGPDMAEGLAHLRPAHLHLVLSSAAQPVDWPGTARLCAAAGARLRVDIQQLPAGRAAQALAPLACAMAQAGIVPEAVGVFPSSPPAVAAARQVFPDSAIGGGTPWFFTQLNRIEDLGAVDFLSFTTSALVHGADDESVMAGLQSLPAMVETLARRHPGVPLRVGPSAIAARASPLGGQPDSDGSRRLALARRDPRTRALLGAAWVIGYITAFAGAGAGAGAEALSVLALRGDDGLLGPEPSPAFFALACLGGGAPLAVIPSAAPGRLAAVEAGTVRLLANLGEAPLPMAGPAGDDARVLDTTSWLAFTGGAAQSPWRALSPHKPWQLPAYAVARLGGGTQ